MSITKNKYLKIILSLIPNVTYTMDITHTYKCSLGSNILRVQSGLEILKLEN